MRECCMTIQKYDWVSNNAKPNANGWSVPLSDLSACCRFGYPGASKLALCRFSRLFQYVVYVPNSDVSFANDPILRAGSLK